MSVVSVLCFCGFEGERSFEQTRISSGVRTRLDGVEPSTRCERSAVMWRYPLEGPTLSGRVQITATGQACL